MNALSINIQGLGHKSKKEWIKKLNIRHKINFLAIQETKMACVSHMDVKFIWGNSNYQYISSDAIGSSGGILCIWEASVFKKDYVTISDNFIAIYGTWVSNNAKVLFVSIYAPQQAYLKRVLWEYISVLIGLWNGEVIIMGDFNEVRSADERRGSMFYPSMARCFNNFISSFGLVDIKLEGFSFTWSHPSASKLSKLDRFLVSEGILVLFPSISALCLDRHLSDHRPILLHEVHTDFGPIPFRFYHSWFSFEGFDDMVEHTWNSFSLTDYNGMIRFKKKLQGLKIVIRNWVKAKKHHLFGVRCSIKNELSDIDKDLDRGDISDSKLHRRMDLLHQLHDIDISNSKDFIQKSKIKWAVEGDENSKFFHGIINKKRSQLAVRGVFVDGLWVTDPCKVKDAFRNHFEARFQEPDPFQLKFQYLVSDTQSAFVANRQILDGPFILSEVSSNWCSILRELEVLKSKGFNFLSHCSKRIGDGCRTRFWQDRWLAGMVLRDSFPRIFALELDKDVSVASKMREDMVGSFRRNVRDGVERQQFSELLLMLESVSLSSAQDRWCCDLSGDDQISFSVGFLWNHFHVLFVELLKNLFTIPCFNVPWPSSCSVKFVDGGICLGKICRQFQIGLPGSLISVYLISLRRCWKVFSILRGGLFGCFAIDLSLMLRLLDDRLSLMILFPYHSFGVLVDVIGCCLGNIG
nr:RNA-directed DNA polymerase, eukaryota [Tanacetum cinerariifolium]